MLGILDPETASQRMYLRSRIRALAGEKIRVLKTREEIVLIR
jgi:hypothetical protein